MSTTPDHSPDQETTPAAVRDTHDDAPDIEDTPEAQVAEQERSRLATHPDPTIAEDPAETTPAARRAQVRFVRPSELATRGAEHTLAFGQQLNRKLVGVVKETIREERDALRQRLAARSVEVSVTGPEHTQTRAAGREGVSR